MKSAVTVSLVPEARGGPFVFWDDLPAACRSAKAHGFDAIELFPPSPHAVDPGELKTLLADNGLSLAAVGTGAGWVKHKLTLTHPDEAVRGQAREFVRAMIEFAATFGAPAIIGSMQGRFDPPATRADALSRLADALNYLGEHAATCGTMLIFEPLNRYETNLVNRLADGVELLERVGRPNVKLLADLFHMNIEEADLPAAIREAGSHVGHVHLADSNRRPAGYGHTSFTPINDALKAVGYAGYLSAECFPFPDPDAAARQTRATILQHFR